MKYYQAADTFVAVLNDGTERLVKKGEPYAENHELVKRDLSASGKGRLALFSPMDTGDEAAPKRRLRST